MCMDSLAQSSTQGERLRSYIAICDSKFAISLFAAL
jgi:hypothetical protein